MTNGEWETLTSLRITGRMTLNDHISSSESNIINKNKENCDHANKMTQHVYKKVSNPRQLEFFFSTNVSAKQQRKHQSSPWLAFARGMQKWLLIENYGYVTFIAYKFCGTDKFVLIL